MDLTDYKPKKQREILKNIAKYLEEIAYAGCDDSVNTTLATLQEGFLDVLNGDDFFGTEGWEHMLGLD